eukprot:scaffold45563_cov59-Phaeocystis_antarctica.AAC.2
MRRACLACLAAPPGERVVLCAVRHRLAQHEVSVGLAPCGRQPGGTRPRRRERERAGGGTAVGLALLDQRPHHQVAGRVSRRAEVEGLHVILELGARVHQRLAVAAGVGRRPKASGRLAWDLPLAHLALGGVDHVQQDAQVLGSFVASADEDACALLAQDARRSDPHRERDELSRHVRMDTTLHAKAVHRGAFRPARCRRHRRRRRRRGCDGAVGGCARRRLEAAVSSHDLGGGCRKLAQSRGLALGHPPSTLAALNRFRQGLGNIAGGETGQATISAASDPMGERHSVSTGGKQRTPLTEKRAAKAADD